MQTKTTTHSSFFFDGPTVVETARGSAHPKVPTTRQPLGIAWARRVAT